MAFQLKATIRVAQGWLKRVEHTSSVLGSTTAVFAIYQPDVSLVKKLPVVYWLSGLTCTDENFSQKAGAFQAACDNQVVLIMPDTSPRGDGVPDESPKEFDFGVGAGFYLNATTEKYRTHYNMYDYVVKELPSLVETHFNVAPLRSVSGHSMGGHGALTIALKNPDRYTSVSAFAPICNPTNVPWGTKALSLYLGDAKEAWKQYDACELIKNYKGKDLHILCDQGTADNFLCGDVNQLQPLAFIAAAQEAKVPVTFRMQAGFDHSYYFMSTFIGEHIAHHARLLHAAMAA
uniref:S-formylglutathione hydrolase n=1 Tax=Zooxanthella nutricula TaxID=1333877 RepID=A0A6U9N238_9DINO|mmetsp:Transcript_46380/g.140722  ORF Transcript_46380/g.140722 Transcript_46380/m.140722 type:complete len:290 (+) Transcript_46380:75-944(+)